MGCRDSIDLYMKQESPPNGGPFFVVILWVSLGARVGTGLANEHECIQ